MTDDAFKRQHLQPWYDEWLSEHRETDLLYVNRNARNEPSLAQVHFVRDTLGGLFWSDIPYDARPIATPRASKESAWVIGEHRSKSVRLPVYSLERPDLGLQVVLRDNYYNWNVSVVSEIPVAASILEGFRLDFTSEDERAKYRPGDYWDYLFFEGFPSDLMFGPHSLNARRFSIAIGNEFALYTFCWLLLRDRRRR